MKLSNLNPFHHTFKIDDLTFKTNDVTDDNIVVGVYDEGGLQLGEFTVEYDEDGKIEVDDSAYDNILERLRKSGNSDTIMRNLKKMVSSLTD